MSLLEGNVAGSVSGGISLNGGTGTDNYNDLNHKPQINGVTLSGNKDSADLNIISDVTVNGATVVNDTVAEIIIPPTPTIPVTDVTVNGSSAMVGTVAEIVIPPTPTIPVTDVTVNGASAMVGTVAEIVIPEPPAPNYPVTDVTVDGVTVMNGTVAEIVMPPAPTIPVTDVTVNGDSVLDGTVAEIIIPAPPAVPVQDVEVNGSSVLNADGIAEITIPPTPTIPVTDVRVNGSSVMSGTVANIVPTAAGTSYNNAVSGYSAANVNDAIDEAAGNISQNALDISGNTNDISALQTYLTDLVKISNCTLMGNGTKYANIAVTAIAGYTAIGVVGYDPTGSFIAGYELAGVSINISEQKLYGTWGVDLGSNAGIIAKVLYIRSDSV